MRKAAKPPAHPPAAQPARKRLRLGPLWLELFLFGCVAALAAFVLMAASPAGTRGLFNLLASLSGGRVTVAHVEGTLWDELSLLDIRVATAKTQVNLDRARLRWQPMHLLAGRVVVEQLTLGKLEIKAVPSHEPATVPSSLSLPLAVQVKEASIGNLTINGQRVLLGAVAKLDSDGDRHQLQLIRAQTPWFSGQGKVDLAGARPFKVAGQLALTGEAEGAPWQVTLTLDHHLEALQLKGAGAGGPKGIKPFKASFDLALRPFSPSPYGILQSGRLDTEAMDLRVLSSALPRTALDLQLSAKPQACAVTAAQPCVSTAVAAELSLRNPLAGDWPAGRLPLSSVDAAFGLDASQVRIQRFDANLAGGQLKLAGGATIKQFNLEAVLSKLDPHSFGGPVWPISGRLALKGTPAKPQLSGQLGDARLGVTVDASLSGEGEQQAVVAKAIKLTSSNGTLDLTGQLGLAGKRTFALKGLLAGFDPAALSGLLGRNVPAGSLNANVAANGQLMAPLAANFKLDFQPSRFNNQPLAGQMQADWHGEQVQNVKASLSLGANRLNAQGGFGRPGDSLQLDLQLPDLATLGPDFKGRLDAKLALSGSLRRPTLEGTAQGDQLRLPGHLGLQQANLIARLDAAPDKPATSPLSLKLDLVGLSAPKLELASAHLNLAGTQASHTMDLTSKGTVAAQAFDLVLKGGGSLDSQGWRGRVDALENRGDWPVTLNAPAQLAIATDGGSVSGLDAVAVGAKIKLQRAEWHRGRFTAVGDVRDLAMGEWLARLPDLKKHIATDLVLAARFDLRGEDKLGGSLVLERQSGDVALSVDDPTIKPMPLKLTNARAQLDLNGDHGTVAVDLKSTAFGSANGRLTTQIERTETAWRLTPGAPLEGRLQAEMPSLAWVGPLLGPAAKVEGRLSAELTAGGVVGEPRWFGKLNAQDAALRLPDTGINWREGRLEATLDGDTAQLAALSLKGGKGQVTAAGRMALRDAGPEGAVTVTFDHFGALTRPDRNLIVSGETNLGVQGQALTLNGKLTADEGLIELVKSDASVLGDDVIVKGRPEQAKRKSKATPLTLRLDLDLGQKFVFKGQGVDARLSGLVRLAASPSQSLTASGALKVEEGRYAAYGQNLSITRGIITFQGPLDNPALDILAIRKNLPVEVGVKIVGTTLAPRVSLTSDTAMADAEKLSWLVLGRGSASGGGDADLLLTAADALFSAGESVGLRQQMAGRLGLDDISLGRSDAYSTKTDSNGNALAGRVVSLGKRLSDRAYVSYEQSLDGVGYAVKLTYQLTRRISLALTAGKTSAADVLYSWTFD